MVPLNYDQRSIASDIGLHLLISHVGGMDPILGRAYGARFMFGHVKCEFASEKCSKEWVGSWLVVCLASVSCALPLVYPFCNSIGIKTTPGIYMGVQSTKDTYIIFVIWVLSWVIVSSQKYLTVMACIIESFGTVLFLSFIMSKWPR